MFRFPVSDDLLPLQFYETKLTHSVKLKKKRKKTFNL